MKLSIINAVLFNLLTHSVNGVENLSECDVDACFARSLDIYGASGSNYYCVKGCAQMSGGRIGNKERFCTTSAGPGRYNEAYASCEGASSNENNRNVCRNGAEFWNAPASTLASDCDVDACFARCLNTYGATGSYYYSIKGCAHMSGGRISNKERFCTTSAGPGRYNEAYAGCQGASSSENNRNVCRNGAEFWNVPSPTVSPSKSPSASPLVSPSASPLVSQSKSPSKSALSKSPSKPHDEELHVPDDSAVLCEGQDPEHYCDCSFDCQKEPAWCSCSAAEKCCAENGAAPPDYDPSDYDNKEH